jgi:hypothetical protein
MQKKGIIAVLIIIVLLGGFISYSPQPAQAERCGEVEGVVDCGFVGPIQVIETGPSRIDPVYHSIPIGPIHSGDGVGGGPGASGNLPPVRTPGYRIVCTGQNTPALTCYDMPLRAKACPSFLRVVLHGAGPAWLAAGGIIAILSGPPGWVVGFAATAAGFATGYIQLDKLWEERRQCEETALPLS